MDFLSVKKILEELKPGFPYTLPTIQVALFGVNMMMLGGLVAELCLSEPGTPQPKKSLKITKNSFLELKKKSERLFFIDFLCYGPSNSISYKPNGLIIGAILPEIRIFPFRHFRHNYHFFTNILVLSHYHSYSFQVMRPIFFMGDHMDGINKPPKQNHHIFYTFCYRFVLLCRTRLFTTRVFDKKYALNDLILSQNGPINTILFLTCYPRYLYNVIKYQNNHTCFPFLQ